MDVGTQWEYFSWGGHRCSVISEVRVKSKSFLERGYQFVGIAVGVSRCTMLSAAVTERMLGLPRVVGV